MRIADINIACFSCIHRELYVIMDSENMEESTILVVDNRCKLQPRYNGIPYGKLYVHCPSYEPIT